MNHNSSSRGIGRMVEQLILQQTFIFTTYSATNIHFYNLFCNKHSFLQLILQHTFIFTTYSATHIHFYNLFCNKHSFLQLILQQTFIFTTYFATNIHLHNTTPCDMRHTPSSISSRMVDPICAQCARLMRKDRDGQLFTFKIRFRFDL